MPNSYYTRTPLGHHGIGFADRYKDCAMTDLDACERQGLSLDEAVAVCSAADIPKWMQDPLGRGWDAYISAVYKEANLLRKDRGLRTKDAL